MGVVIATCGHQLTEKEGIGKPFWYYDGYELSWLVYCKKCKSKLTPVFMYDVNDFIHHLQEKDDVANQ